MENRFARLGCSLFFVLVFFAGLAIPCYASTVDYSSRVYSYWDQLWYALVRTSLEGGVNVDGVYEISGSFSPVVQSLAGLVSGVCGVSDDAYHHASGFIDGEIHEDSHGCFSFAVCSYCGEHFKVYSSDLASVYDAYVSTLDDPLIASSDVGISLPFYLSAPSEQTFQDNLSSGYILDYDFDVNRLMYTVGTSYLSQYGAYYFYCPELVFHTPSFSVSEDDTFNWCSLSVILYGRVPYSPSWGGSFCLQTLVDGSWSSVAYLKPSCSSVSDPLYGNIYTQSPASVSVALYVGNTYRVQYFCEVGSFSGTGSATYYGAVRGIELSGTTLTSATNTVVAPVSSRSAPIFQTVNNYNSADNSTNYYIGTIDAGGNVINTYNVDLFDEQTMLIKNPVTGETWTATSWEYDYTTRSYDCILDDGSVVSITYGDDYITFMYPDSDGLFHKDYYYYVVTTYNAPSDDTCDHVFTGETTAPPGCITPGERTYTCELCGYTFVESILATGHVWYVVETVETVLDDDGDVTKVGYTLYGCENCDATYKQYDGTGQPGPPDGIGSSDSNSGFFDWWAEQWQTFVDTLHTWFDAVISAIGSGGGGETVSPGDDPFIEDEDKTPFDDNEYVGIVKLLRETYGFLSDFFTGFISGGVRDFLGMLNDQNSLVYGIFKIGDFGGG